MRHKEWHVTVEGDPMWWHRLCNRHGIKPLWIELNNFERQLMCAAKFNPCEQILEDGDFKIVRVKHEVSQILHGETPWYWECHVKFDGPFQPQLPWTSRDLFRDNRWYLTLRRTQPFDPSVTVACATIMAPGSIVAGYEYEAALVDTFPELDARWK